MIFILNTKLKINDEKKQVNIYKINMDNMNIYNFIMSKMNIL